MTPTTQLDDAALGALRDEVRGDVLEAGDPGYDDARAVWNARIDREPAAIVRCSGLADVIAGVNVARANDTLLSVKSGGHHVSGSAVCDGGLTLDLSEMDAVLVDPEAKTARVQAGATWGDVDRETQQFGLAVPGGQDPNIGVSGLTLGGGFGWLSRKYGLTCDNLLAADVVTADGEFVRASEDENPDLFWALRGGGGNFGVVTSFEFRLHEVGPEVLGGSLIYPLADAAAAARAYREFMADAPREVRVLFGIMELPAVSFYPEELRNERVVILVAFHCGDPEEGEEALAPLRDFGTPRMDSIRRRSYESFQRAGDSGGRKRTYVRSQFLESLSAEAIETIVTYGSDPPSSGATVFAASHSGAVTDPPADVTAYGHRDDAYRLLIEARWSDPDRDDEHVEWVRSFHEALEPYTTGGAEMNFLTDDEDRERIRASYGPNYERLAAVKAAWDPDNFFRTNQNVEPE